MFSHTIRQTFSRTCIRQLHYAVSRQTVVDKVGNPAVSSFIWKKQYEKQNTINGLEGRLAAMNLGKCCTEEMELKPGAQKEYQLPTITGIASYKHTILDPRVNVALELPDSRQQRSVVEKLTPGSINIVPMVDPTRNGLPVVEKQVMPYLVRIRHKKMKKHKLKRFRKRMIFLNRKLAEIKRKKKDAILRGVEAKFLKSGQNFDPMNYISTELEKARRGGFKVNVFQSSLR